MNIAIFYNVETNPKNKTYALETAKILERHKVKYRINPPEKDFGKFDLALATGGDGTVLYTANLLASRKIPILGINFGHRGYLCGISKEIIEDGIEKILSGNYSMEEKTRIQAKIGKRNNPKLSLEALNEISIGGINRTVSINARIKTPHKFLETKIIGDGLIVATQTGSTAYNINAGGSMLLTEALSVVANNAFFESKFLLPVTRSLVIPSESALEISDLSHNTANLPFVIADGQKAVKIGKEDIIYIKKAKNTNLFIRL